MENWKKRAIFYLISQNISLFGSSVVGYAMIWYVTLKSTENTGANMTVLILATMLPQVLISFFSGAWADRHNRKKIVIFSDLFVALVTLGLAILFLLGKVSFPIIIVGATLRSIGGGLQAPASTALYPQLVPNDELTRVLGINQSISSVMQLLAPALGGVLLTFGLQFAFFTDVVTALVAIFILLFLKIPTIVNQQASDSVIRNILDGLRYTFNNKIIRDIIIYYGIVFFLITPCAFLTPLQIKNNFGPDVWRLSLMEMVWVGGSMLGGVYISIKKEFERKNLVLSVCAVAFGLLFGLLGVPISFWLYTSIITVSGIFMPLLSTVSYVAVQEQTEEHMMGRVMSLIQIITGISMPLAMILFGPLADAITVEWVLIGTGIILLIYGLYEGFKKENLS